MAVGATTKCLSCSNKENNTIHGNTASRSYNIWRQMIRRCVDPTFKGYKNYGGRGIKVCERWYKFQNFLFDMGEKPEGLQIDRTNNDGNYEPSNCRWVTPKQNCANRRIKVSGRD